MAQHTITKDGKDYTFSSQSDVLAAVGKGTMPVDVASQALEILNPPAHAAGQVYFRVGNKGGVCAYGINVRNPVTLYADQWERLLEKADDIRKFIKDNADALDRKADSDEVKAKKALHPTRVAAAAKAKAAADKAETAAAAS